ncbi:MAG: hypothetical protein VB087_11790 [Candidatus Limiplasma sp.]|nr:hypothetical protein [Candidatus Limiplasma sp.]
MPKRPRPAWLTQWATRSAITIWVITAAVCLASILALGNSRAYVAANSGSVYPVRFQRLIEALNYVGVCDQESAATVWAEGLKLRNAAMQYSVMNSELRTEYAAQLKSTFPNWVTGISSPFIENYEILRINPLSDTQSEIVLKFTTATSTGIADTLFATLTVEREGPFWRIKNIAADDGLFVYTGFNPR